MPRYRLTVAYDGTHFHGWQKQCGQDGEEDLRTAQGVLEQAVIAAVREPVTLVGASRTDAGVHAVGQVAAFTCERELPIERLCAAVNSRLPDDLQVRDGAIVNADFSPISDAIAKSYRYRIAWGRTGPGGVPRPLFGRYTTFWTPYRLDAVRMNEAARRLLGEHDFASFTRVNHNRESTVRTIHDCLVTADRRRRRLHIDVAGDGFLYNMIRIIAGTLIEIGRGKIEPEAIEGILAATDRSRAGDTLPPEGLCLMWIKYPDA
ncbi:MAG: tRNA pseudouridine(38-40) synthase TruA [Planctomycetota bacterium]|nr:MAG: tRNA pseudouridine(38-40) synthase TruA [Planctomycetota bacterium]